MTEKTTPPRPGDKPCSKGCVMYEPYMREMGLAVQWEGDALRLRANLRALMDAAENYMAERGAETEDVLAMCIACAREVLDA